MKSGIIVLSELRGSLCKMILDIQQQYDPKLARAMAPHVTITGSSGMGPISTRTTIHQLRAALEPIVQVTAPMALHFKRPVRFMHTNIIVLPLDPHGPLRVLHERILKSGLDFERPRFTFTPHVTLTLFRELSREQIRELLAMRIDEPVMVDHISAHRTLSLVDTKKLLELPLTGLAPGSPRVGNPADRKHH